MATNTTVYLMDTETSSNKNSPSKRKVNRKSTSCLRVVSFFLSEFLEMCVCKRRRHAPFFSVSFVFASPKGNDRNILDSYCGANSPMKTKSGSKELKVQNMRLSETKL